ncbi:somatostatin receptor type 4-like [Mytilus trossulus]|uniref:somatostatin receptor type 4-like n=1 Tax=Mytilus trossulus TaxID=6551 RepID=UPI003007A9A8
MGKDFFENTTVFTFLSEFDQVWPGQIVIEVIILVIIMIAAFTGNIMVIVAVYRRKKMRNVTNFFISNLAVADLLFASWIPFIATTRVTRDWIFGDEICKLVTFMQFLSGISSILTMMLISIERYTCIMYSPNRKMTVKISLFCIVLVWILSACFPIPVAFAQSKMSTTIKGASKTFCGIVWPRGFHIDAYLASMGVLFFLIPLLVITMNYYKIYRLVKRSATAACQHRSESSSRKQIRLVKMFAAIVCVFVIMWLPFFVLSFLAVNYNQITSSQFTVTIIIALLNTCQNPIIYGYFNLKFRKEFKDMCKCCTEDVCTNGRRLTYTVQTGITISNQGTSQT